MTLDGEQRQLPPLHFSIATLPWDWRFRYPKALLHVNIAPSIISSSGRVTMPLVQPFRGNASFRPGSFQNASKTNIEQVGSLAKGTKNHNKHNNPMVINAVTRVHWEES